MQNLRSSTALVTILALLGALPANAASFDIPNGTTATSAQTLTGTQTGTIDSGGTLNTTVSSVTLGVATGSGVVLDNEGTITSGNRAIDTSSSATGTLTVINNGTITSTDDSVRLNWSFTSGILNLTNTGTITTASGQVFDFDKASAASASVTVNNSGVIEALSGASDAIRLGGGTISITNSGTISALASDKRAIKFDNDTNVDTLRSLTIDNLIGGVISSGDDAIKISGQSASTSTANIAITNAGTIKSTSGQAIDLGDLVSTGLAIDITNKAGGLITSSDNDAISAGMNTTVHNYGEISSHYTATTADDQNYDGVKFDGTSGTVINYASGVISGSYHGVKASGTTDDITVENYGAITGHNGSGVNSNGTGTVVNYGTITGGFDPAASFGDGDGIDIDHIGTITNYGTIQALGSKGIKPGETAPSTSEGIAIGGGVITNGSASQRSALISGANNGILADDSNRGSIFGALTVTNYGTIEGLDGYGIRVVNDAGYSTSITNYGTITGTDYAVEMGDGDDVFTYEAGSSVSGNVMAEGGNDTLRLGEVSGTFDLSLLGDAATYQDFETLDVASGTSWTVTGTTDFSGATNVVDASLLLDNASLAASSVFVSGTAASLSGNGTVGNTMIGSGATISPGLGGVGTINIQGNLTFRGGSTYAIDLNGAGQSDRIAATGAVTIDPGTSATLSMAKVSGAGTSYHLGQTYTVLTATGGVSGQFDGVASDFAFLTPTLVYNPDAVDVTLARNGVSFASFARTGNQRTVANALDDLQSGALLDAMVMLPSSVPAHAFDQLSGEVHGAATNAMADRSRLMGNAINDRIRNAFGGVGTGSGSSTVTAYGDDGLAGIFDAPDRKTQFWISGMGGWSRYDGDSNGHDLSVDGGGTLFGADALTESGWRVGVAGGYSRDNFSQDDLISSGDSDTYRIAGYGGRQLGPLGLRFGAAYGWSNIHTDRSVSFDGFSDHLSADYDGQTAQAFGEAAWRVDRDLWHYEPFANLAFVHVNTNGFTEKGGAAALSVDSADQNQWQATLGGRIERDIAINGVLGKVSANAGWQHVMGDAASRTTEAFSGGSGFAVSSAAIARDSAVLGAGVQFEIGHASTVSLNYSGQFSKSGNDQSVSGALNVKF